MKRVLILTVTAGNGHNAAANNIKNKLESAGVEVKLVDLIKDLSSKFNAWITDKGYGISVGYLRHIYNFFFSCYEKSPKEKANVCGAQLSVKFLHGKLLKIIYEFQPDVIYCTHFYAGMALTNLRRVYELPSVNVSGMLDYGVSPFWEANVGGIDYFGLSHEDFRNKLIERGFEDKNLLTTGIPLHAKFDKSIDKAEARKELGLKDMFTVLIFFGGGYGNAAGGGLKSLKVLKKYIKDEIQIVIINGKNEKAKNKIDKMSFPKNIHLKNIGFCTEVDWVMAASDVMIGKGGGLCTTETISKKLPLLATAKLPKQEIYNVAFLEKKGTGLIFKNSKDLAKKIEYLYKNPEALIEMQNKLTDLKSEVDGASKRIFNLIMAQPEADYSKIEKNIDYKRVNKIVNKRRKQKNKK